MEREGIAKCRRAEICAKWRIRLLADVAAERIKDMNMSTKNNGHGDFFHALTVPELEQFAITQHSKLVTDRAVFSSSYWLVGECERELANKKGLTPAECLHYLTHTLGLDGEPLELAATIRENHADVNALVGVTVAEALGNPQEPSNGHAERGGNGAPIPVGESDVKQETAQSSESVSPQSAESFTRETLPGAVGDISKLDDQTVLAGMEAECAALSALDAPFPARYHRLGVYILESTKRFGDEHVKEVLRGKGIDGTRKWRAEQIATLYSFEQATAFPSLRAILGTLPQKQPRMPKSKPNDGCDHKPTAPRNPPPAPAEDELVDNFIQLGIEVRERVGDEAFDEAVEQIRAHVPETFEDAFAEVC